MPLQDAITTHDAISTVKYLKAELVGISKGYALHCHAGARCDATHCAVTTE